GSIPSADRNHTGWWVFWEVQRWVATGADAKSQKRFPVWENTRLVRARSREKAYNKAIKLANEGMPSQTEGGEWQFVGLSSLLPVYEELDDGSELLWTNHGSIGLVKLKRLDKAKDKLPAFDDRDGA
ncbi:MAG: DUF4288 domain-containing protein, partial [Tepidisphaeraceae bacterium]